MLENFLNKLKVAANFSRSAASYDRFSQLQKTLSMDLAAKVGMLGINPSSILDVGTGTGDLAALMLEGFPGAKVHGIDIAEGMINIAKEKAGDKDIVFKTADAEAIPFEDETFDLVVSSSTYQWVEDLPKAFSEVFRVLKNGGIFAFVTFGPKTLTELKQAYKLKGNPSANYLHEYKSSHAIGSMLEDAGFDGLDIVNKDLRQLYRNMRDMFKVLKGIGAMNAMKNHPMSLKGHKRMMDMIHYYETTFAQGDGIYATYEVIEAACKKPRT